LKCTSDEWEEMHRIAHSLGLRTTATMMFRLRRELRHRVNHLATLAPHSGRYRRLHRVYSLDLCGGNTALGKNAGDTAVDYLKTLAVSRLYLDNIDHIQSSWLTPGIKFARSACQFGADDVGSILIEENVVFAAGVRNRTNEPNCGRIISDAGFIPAARDPPLPLLRSPSRSAQGLEAAKFVFRLRFRRADRHLQGDKHSAAEAARIRRGSGLPLRALAFEGEAEVLDAPPVSFERFVGQRIGFAILFAVNVIDAEGFERL